ncbi:C3a anaphylatoxin chemotactic receptor-like [Chanodichthys erythropterus]|uniref:C3a anaphylatoxin chemotactic receptor-like n=1 Tax=Chanodichthys erythropterus TaxID=933992 RepID=UPI00351EE36C
MTVNSIWFLNLAIADFIIILSLIIYIFICYFSLCFSLLYLAMTITLNLFASIFFLVVISLDRCLCTWMVVWSQNNRTVLRARIICVIVWVSSISCSIPFFVNVIPATFQVTYEFFVGFLIPFLIIASSHIAIGVRIKCLKMGKQHRSYRVVIAIILTFYICWFPHHVCSFCAIKINNWNANEAFCTAFSDYLILLNSCLNPILYVFMCDQYKKKLKQSLLLVLEMAFAEDHFGVRQMQKDEQNNKTTIELLENVSP